MSRQAQRHNLTAIIYDKKGNILSIGKNSYVKTHPLQAKYAQKAGEARKDHQLFLHAEIHAITKCRNLDGAYKMLITRYTRDGKPANAKPCAICEAAIKNETPIKRIEYTTN